MSEKDCVCWPESKDSSLTREGEKGVSSANLKNESRMVVFDLKMLYGKGF